MRTVKDISLLTGRLLVSVPFIISLFHRFTAFNWTIEYSRINSVTWATVFCVWIVTILEIIGLISLLPGYKTELGALSLLFFFIPVTFIFHGFWTLTGTDRSTQMGYFISNLSLT